MTDTETKTIRVRPVDGRLVRDESTHQPITEERDVPDTRTIRRRIADGDLALVGGDADAPELPDDERARMRDKAVRMVQDAAASDGNPAWGINPAEDTALTRDERDATRAADQGLEKDRY